MVVRSKGTERVLRNIVARLNSGRSESPVIAGNHYDAWVYGASDPGSGTAVLLETAEALAALKKEGWKPSRDLIFAFWDGEEYGMLGSTAWVRQNVELVSNAAAYVNLDTAYRARDLAAYVMPGLRNVLDRSLSGVKDPLSGHELLEIRGEYQNPGFSADTNPFMLFSAMPVAEIGFGRSYSLYHSVYDNLTWIEKFGDPDAKYRRTLASILTRYLLLLSGEKILPYDFEEISKFVDVTLREWQKEFPVQLNRNSNAIRDLRNHVDQFRSAAQNFQERKQKRNGDFKGREKKINELLIKTFQVFYSSDQGNILLKSSSKKGCAGEALPQVYNAVSSGFQDAKSFKELSEAFAHGMSFIKEAESVMDQ
jgi:N-acetylated-alpha-linked acidic dipeptidase